ncbi:hypothetical protein AMJ57_03500 [Parcubacteria bacterium SG8_24]|nr:MAG: hypothetical protein AMJ57_03500 [Parcubacteria bacterium SG8_24]
MTVITDRYPAAVRRTLLLALAAVFSVLVPFLSPTDVRAADPEEVRSFISEIAVHEDGRITVTERIDYYFPNPRHGIYRDIPVRYTDERGDIFEIPIEVLEVRGAPFKVERSRAAIRLKIGDPDATVIGIQSYVIVYEAIGALRYFEDHDELYWNVTGHEWNVPLRQVSAVVTLPPSVPADQVRTACYTGPFGSTASDCLVNLQDSTSHFVAQEPLTVVVGWPPGLVARLEAVRPSPVLPWLWLLLPAAAFILLMRRWWTRGRDVGGRGTIMVEYEPPDGIRPAEFGVLMDETAHLRDITAIIVDLAVRGYLRIKEIEKKGLIFKSKDYEFERLKEYQDDDDLRSYEKKILDIMFGAAKTVTMSKLKSRHAFHGELTKIKNQIYEQVVGQGYFPSNPDRVRAKYLGAGIGITILAWVLGAMILPAFLPDHGPLPMISLMLSGVMVLVFAPLMPKRTGPGVLAWEKAKGFEEYLEKAERYRLQWQEKERIFETFLPYAMAIGVADKWAKAFEDIDMPEPEWYVGTGTFRTSDFGSSIRSLNSSLNSTVTSAPQRSSSGSGFSGGGGGGFSGGGGGGGGGGSW